MDGVFAGGDAVSGPNTVTGAMAHGKVAAQMIDKYIRGEKVELVFAVTRAVARVEATELSDEESKNLKRPEMPAIPVDQRTSGFKEVELGLSEAEAMAEAKRCLRCDLEKKE
jgi:pyruvate/2-oxoglutarate dehydrogenase complex dihydrolipoamide dehydrogenase (E3) component